MADRPDEASRLARLLGELEELEETRMGVLKRLESVRSSLLAAGDRTAAMRASLDLLCDHITDTVAAEVELSVLEREMGEVEDGVDDVGMESSGLAFESDSLHDTLAEADEELERLSARLVERKGKQTRGH